MWELKEESGGKEEQWFGAQYRAARHPTNVCWVPSMCRPPCPVLMPSKREGEKSHSRGVHILVGGKGV